MSNFVFSGPRDRGGRAYAVVLESVRDGTSLVTTVRVSKYPGEPLIPSVLWERDPQREVLQFHRVRDEAGSRLTLETFNFIGGVPEPDYEYLFQLWWTKDAMDLVTDTTRTWRRAIHPDDGGCDFCPLTYESIVGNEGEKEAYLSEGDWITIDAHNKYIRDDFLKVRK